MSRPSPDQCRSRRASIFLVMASMASGWVAVAAFAACSSSDSGTGPGGNDGGDASLGDAATDVPHAPINACDHVRGPACDLILQDCPSGSECKVQTSDAGSDAAPTTACVPAGNGKGAAGDGCCPDQSGQCKPGLVCVGSVACSGNGTLTGRCSPACCPEDDATCGTAADGHIGVCERLITQENGLALFYACAYEPGCKPFHIQSCPTNEVCLINVRDTTSYICHATPQPGGKSIGQACTYGNECADGLACLGPVDARTCKMLCYRPNGGTPPFDASAVRNEPYYGGCPGAAACSGTISDYPGYLGYCP